MSKTRATAAKRSRKNREESVDAAREHAEQAYEQALLEAGVNVDDLALVRELAEQTSELATPQTVGPTRIYL